MFNASVERNSRRAIVLFCMPILLAPIVACATTSAGSNGAGSVEDTWPLSTPAWLNADPKVAVTCQAISGPANDPAWDQAAQAAGLNTGGTGITTRADGNVFESLLRAGPDRAELPRIIAFENQSATCTVAHSSRCGPIGTRICIQGQASGSDRVGLLYAVQGIKSYDGDGKPRAWSCEGRAELARGETLLIRPKVNDTDEIVVLALTAQTVVDDARFVSAR